MASEASTSQQYDLTQKLLPNLDRQLGLALVDFLDEQQVYNHNDLLQAKLDLLKSTNMVTYIAQLDAELHGGSGSEQVQKGQSLLGATAKHNRVHTDRGSPV